MASFCLVTFSSNDNDALHGKVLRNLSFLAWFPLLETHCTCSRSLETSLPIGSSLTKKQTFPTGTVTKASMCSTPPHRRLGKEDVFELSTVLSQPSVNPSGFELWPTKARNMLIAVSTCWKFNPDLQTGEDEFLC